jgi:hypothetical protein
VFIQILVTKIGIFFVACFFSFGFVFILKLNSALCRGSEGLGWLGKGVQGFCGKALGLLAVCLACFWVLSWGFFFLRGDNLRVNACGFGANCVPLCALILYYIRATTWKQRRSSGLFALCWRAFC